MENIYNYKTAVLTASFKDADSKKGIVTGYFSAFGNKDSDGDIIVKGAFTKTIEERGPQSKQPRIKHLLNHKTDQPLGKLLVLKEDNSGLYYESQIGKHTAGIEFIKMVESDLITEHSIGFRVMDRDKEEIREIMLWEGSSLTAWGANSLTPVTSLKSPEYENHVSLFMKEQKFFESILFNPDLSEEQKENYLLFNKQLLQIIIDLTKKATGPEQLSATSPEKHDEFERDINKIISKSNLLHYDFGRIKQSIAAT